MIDCIINTIQYTMTSMIIATIITCNKRVHMNAYNNVGLVIN